MPHKYDEILLLSGGIDSTVVLAHRRSTNRNPLCLVFDYGQRNRREIEFAVKNAATYHVDHLIIRVDYPAFTVNTPLVGTGRRVLSEYRTLDQIRDGGTPPSYVPFRNGIFLAYAAAIGEDRGITEILCGGNGLNSGNYPDDTAHFAKAMEAAVEIGTSPGFHPRISFPNSQHSKAAVVKWAALLGVILEDTWSCYHSHPNHCGVCDSCIQRQAAGAPLT